jgi:poly(A) polymerase
MRPMLFDDSWTDSAVRRLVVDAGDLLTDLMSLARADAKALAPRASEERAALLERLEGRISLLSGNTSPRPLPQDLGGLLRSELYAHPSDAPRIGEAMRELLDLIADGKVPAGRDATFYVDYLKEHR